MDLSSRQIKLRKVTCIHVVSNICRLFYSHVCETSVTISTEIEQPSKISLWCIVKGYWLDMEIYVRVLVPSNIARRQDRNINYAPERVHIFPFLTNTIFITYP